MNKKTNGSLDKESRQKDFCSNSTSVSFQDVLTSFKALIEVEDPVRHEFELIRAARSLNLPINSYRKMYRAWKLQEEET